MEDNPFAVLAGLFPDPPGMDGGAFGGFAYGTVRSAPTEEAPATPLTVEVGGIRKSAPDLVKNATVGSLSLGDRVLVLALDDAQRYLIFCKVVSA